MKDKMFMKRALELAQMAADNDEVPVGAVIVLRDEIIAESRNRTREDANPLRHAEICAIEQAAAVLENERLSGCTLYVTKEPCSMCAGAIVNARIERVVIGASDIRFGACGTVLSVCGNEKLNHIPVIEFGLCREESVNMLKTFFLKKREALKTTDG